MDIEKIKLCELRAKAQEYGLPSSGTKAEIWRRLTDKCGNELWVKEIEEARTNEAITVEEPEIEEPRTSRSQDDRITTSQLEFQLWEQQRRLMQMEFELERRELELIRKERQGTQMNTPNIKIAAELISDFDGTPEKFEVWQKQLIMIKETYNLSCDMVKIIMSMKLKGKAIEWFHSKAEHLSMPYDELIIELRNMFSQNHSRVHLRKKFEKRIRETNESFREYAHEKIILGNRIPINDRDMLDYLIEGIPDRILRNQAYIQNFSNKESLISAFDKTTLQDTTYKKTEVRKSFEWHKPNKETFHQNKQTTCFNCGKPGHVSTNCMSKQLGPKCFKCNKYGHISKECLNEKTNKACNTISTKKYTKTVKVDKYELDALIDTGSDLTLMREDIYTSIGSPPLTKTNIRFTGIDSTVMTAIGEFETSLEVDELTTSILIRVVPQKSLSQKLIIGTDMLAKTNFKSKQGTIIFERSDNSTDILPEIFQIDTIEKNNNKAIDLQHIKNEKSKNVVFSCINNYKYVPNKTCETSISMKLILKYEVPVYQKARRISPLERNIVNKQIEDWIKQGIVRPSSSDYASPIVLVKKKNGTFRMCVDFRKFNKKIIRDRYPLPLIEDQLDRLQGAIIFSTLDLKDGFFHIPMSPESIKYTSFIVPDGQFEFLATPFGLCNSLAVFQRYVNIGRVFLLFYTH